MLNFSTQSHTPLSLEELKDLVICPISYEIMRDPVVAADGHTYERGWIAEWIRRSLDLEHKLPLSPKTGIPLANRILNENFSIKKLAMLYQQTLQLPISTEIKYSHEELIQKLHDCFNVDYNEIRERGIVEQTFVNKSGIKVSQKLSIYRRDHTGSTGFCLALNYEQAASLRMYYDTHYPGLIIAMNSTTHSMYKISLDTTQLYEILAPALGRYYQEHKIAIDNLYLPLASRIIRSAQRYVLFSPSLPTAREIMKSFSEQSSLFSQSINSEQLIRILSTQLVGSAPNFQNRR